MTEITVRSEERNGQTVWVVEPCGLAYKHKKSALYRARQGGWWRKYNGEGRCSER